ncbi:MAG: gliding motility protein GldL [Bacteroidota bacterium]|nr:gliding motility protein GldL [Bacteroidota bacterium]
MSENRSKFDIWWNSPETKQKVGAAYSLGASVVIIGAMFKILHLTGAGTMLGIGMSVEAFLFALGIFDSPHKDYEWDKIYDFEGNGEPITPGKGIQSQAQGAGIASAQRSVGLNYTETINDDDVKKLSEGIKNLTDTAQQFSNLSTAIGATDQFVKNIDGATQVTGKFIQNQEALNGATGLLANSYQGISDGMEAVEKNTKLYAGKVENINKNLSSINSIYEIQLKNIQAQSEGLTQQTERLRTVNEGLSVIVDDVQKMKSATTVAAAETENYKAGTTKLAKQIADLNQVYGNMLNALS